MTAGGPVDPLSAAADHADLGLPLSSPTPAKQVVERLTRFLVERQRAYNRGLLDAVTKLRAAIEQLEHRLQMQEAIHERDTEALRVEVTKLQLQLPVQVEEVRLTANLTHVQVVELAHAIGRLERELADLRSVPAPHED